MSRSLDCIDVFETLSVNERFFVISSLMKTKGLRIRFDVIIISEGNNRDHGFALLHKRVPHKD